MAKRKRNGDYGRYGYVSVAGHEMVKAPRVKREPLTLTFEGGKVPDGVRIMNPATQTMMAYPTNIITGERLSPDAAVTVPSKVVRVKVPGQKKREPVVTVDVQKMCDYIEKHDPTKERRRQALACTSLRELFLVYEAVRVEVAQARLKVKPRPIKVTSRTVAR